MPFYRISQADKNIILITDPFHSEISICSLNANLLVSVALPETDKSQRNFRWRQELRLSIGGPGPLHFV